MLHTCLLQEFSRKWTVILFRGYVSCNKMNRYHMMVSLHILAEKLMGCVKENYRGG